MKKFKKIKNVLKVLGTIVMILILNTLSLANSVYAAELGTSANLENLGSCGSLLKYKGNTVITTYVSYNDGQNKYPAYCLNANLPGVGENGNYTVSTNNLITDVKLWRLVINGYPYKTIGELGCANKEEAFTATKHAIYSYIHGNNPNDYTAIGEAGVRTLKALKQIVTNANNSTEVKVGSNITIQAKEGLFKQDSIDKNYVSKTYEIKANASYKDYEVSLESINKKSLPEGIKITDEKNNNKKVFNKGEKFKVLIPIKNLKNNGEFKINVKAQINSKPVLYGKAPNSGLQDYAITTLKYEDGIGNINENYTKNETEVTIYKQEKETKKPLEGVTFNLLDSNKNIIHANLKTNKEGIVKLEDLMPGKYYLIETRNIIWVCKI